MAFTKIIQSLFRRPPPTDAAPAKVARRHWVTNPWHAVSVLPGPRACHAARSLNGTRFLSKDAPKIPLPECDAGSCTCGYRHFQDRRAELRRASDVVASGMYWNGHERRRSAGRRSTD